MSNINIKRTIENIRSGTNVYTPVVELIVNAIQAAARSIRTGEPIPNTLYPLPETKSPLNVIGHPLPRPGESFDGGHNSHEQTRRSALADSS